MDRRIQRLLNRSVQGLDQLKSLDERLKTLEEAATDDRRKVSKDQARFKTHLDKRLDKLAANKQTLLRVSKSIKSVREAVFDNRALNSLAPLPLRFPVLGAPWGIDGFLGRALVDVVQQKRPRVILELGGGVSTVLIAAALEQLGLTSSRHIAVDHLSEFLEISRERVAAQGLSRDTEFWHCPLTEPTDGSAPWYGNLTERLQGVQIDLLLVDGPPGGTHPEARRPALSMLRPFLSPGATIFLDDAGRTEEAQTLEAWRTQWPELELKVSPYGHRHARLNVPSS